MMIYLRKRLAFLVMVIFIVSGMPLTCCGDNYALSSDEGEVISDLKDLPIFHSTWIVQNRVMGSPSPIEGGGWLDISAKNTVTGKKILILRLSDIQTPLEETFEKPDRLIITLPNRTDILEQQNAFSNFTVVYKFTPKDDPIDRAAYQFWWRHPKDARAVKWCMSNIDSKDLCKP